MAANFSFADFPAMMPPAGHTPNFVNPETMHPVVVAVAITTMVLMTLAVAIRTYTKAVILRDMHLEEYLAIIATVRSFFLLPFVLKRN